MYSSTQKIDKNTLRQKGERIMSDKQKEALDKFGAVIENMSDDDLERVLLIGEGMAIMSDIKKCKPDAKTTRMG